MSEENTQVVRGVYEAFGRGDVGAVLGAFDEGIEWYEAEGGAYGGVYRGPGEVAEKVFGPITEDIEGFTVSPEEYFAEGDEVVSLGRYTGRGKQTGTELNIPYTHAWTVRGGKVARFRQYIDTVKFNEVVGARTAA